MKFENVTTKGNEFRLSFEQKIKPFIIEKLKNGEDKVVLSEIHLAETLKTYCVIDTLYMKLKDVISETNLGVSINKRTKDFIFYRISEDVKRESDLFEKNFNDKIKPFLSKMFETKYIIGFEEEFLRKYLNTDYNIDNIYQRLRNVLSDENIIVSINRNVIIKGKKTNEIVFCNIIKKREIDEKSIENVKIDKDKDDFDSYMLESKEKEDKQKEREKNIKKKIVDNFFIDLDTNNLDLNSSKYENIILCPVCRKGEIEYPETICPSCNSQILKKWEHT